MPNRSVELNVGGMTCSSCSRRVERALTRLGDVVADVNYATGIAYVDVPAEISNDELIQAVEGTGYSASVGGKAIERFTLGDFQRRLLVSASLTIPLMTIAMVPGAQFHYWQWVCLVLATPVVIWGAFPFTRAAVLNARHRSVTMDTLVALGVYVSFLYSLWALLFTSAGDTSMDMTMDMSNAEEPGLYFEVSAAVTTLVLLGKYWEHKARAASLVALENLASLNPQFAEVRHGDTFITTPIDQVHVGDEISVAAGNQIPIDGEVISGSATVSQAMVTGESAPISVTVGDLVIGATVLLDAPLVIRATAVAGDTVISSISRLVHQAQMGKAQVTRLVDRVAEIFVPTVMGLALLTALGWFIADHNLSRAITTGVAVLVIACPCALGLATPTALLVGTGRAAELGLLIRGPQSVEASTGITHMYLDKTGTITTGHLVVRQEKIFSTVDWSAIGSIEVGIEQPMARAIARFADSHDARRLPVTELQVVPGHGVSASVNGVTWTIGSPDMKPLSNAAEQTVQEFADKGMSLVVVWQGDDSHAVLGLADDIRDDSAHAIARLREMNIEPVVISGDHEAAVAAVCRELGISEYVAGAKPTDKLRILNEATADGRVVAMSGDGVNDAAALAKAHLSLAMGDGADVAASAADIVLLRSTLSAAVDAVELSRKTMTTIKSNLFWAFFYNVVAIPLAMAGLLSPVIASGTMAFSSVFVVTNSLRLRRFTPRT